MVVQVVAVVLLLVDLRVMMVVQLHQVLHIMVGEVEVLEVLDKIAVPMEDLEVLV